MYSYCTYQVSTLCYYIVCSTEGYVWKHMSQRHKHRTATVLPWSKSSSESESASGSNASMTTTTTTTTCEECFFLVRVRCGSPPKVGDAAAVGDMLGTCCVCMCSICSSLYHNRAVLTYRVFLFVTSTRDDCTTCTFESSNRTQGHADKLALKTLCTYSDKIPNAVCELTGGN